MLNHLARLKQMTAALPYLSFEDAGDSIEFMAKVCDQFGPIIDAFLVNNQINGDLAKSFAYLWYYTFRFTTLDKELNAGSNVDDSIIAAVDLDIKNDSVSKKLFNDSIKTFKTSNESWS